MKSSKKTIKSRIFTSHIGIIIIFMILASIVFNISLNIYVRRQTRTQLISAGELVKKSMNAELFSVYISPNINKEEQEVIKSLLKVNKILKQTESFLDINYALLGRNNNLLYPKDNSNEELELLNKHILPSLQRKKINAVETDKNRIIYFKANGIKYSAFIYPVKIENGNRVGYLFLYSDLNKSNQLIFRVNAILLCILIVTGVIALIISNVVSKKISNPIVELSKYAKKIGERNYDAEFIRYPEDEIGELAETMHSMAEKLSAYDNTMKTFLQNASHELRTPLMSIQGYAEGIKYEVIEDSDSAVDIIIEESKRLSELVEDLLYLSKIDSFQETLNIEEIAVEDLLRSAIERVNGIALKNKKVVKLVIREDNISLQGDEEKLTRAIINILGNCLRYAREEIEITLSKKEFNIIIVLKDDGSGFEEKDLGNLFDRFYKGKNGNYGLGLAITKSIVEKHGGTIIAGNNPEVGAYFKIVF